MLSVYNTQLRNIGRAKCIVCPTNHTVGRESALPAHYVPVPLSLTLIFFIYTRICCDIRCFEGCLITIGVVIMMLICVLQFLVRRVADSLTMAFA